MRFVRSNEQGKTGCLVAIGILFVGIVVWVIIFKMIDKHEEPQKKAFREKLQKESAEIRRSAEDEHSAYFKTNRESIIGDLRTLLKEKKYSDVMEKGKKYLHTGDDELKRIHYKAREMELYARVKKVPAKELELNQEMYAELMRLNPVKELYKRKHQYYTKKVEERRKQHEARKKTLLIKGYDGIKFGMSSDGLIQHLARLEGVVKDKKGNPQFERVPAKPYYRYWINRSKDGKGDQSEVSVWFKDGKVIQIRDVFGGERLNETESAVQVFGEKGKEFIEKWGTPTHRQRDMITWARDDGVVVLRLIRPDNPYALPVLKVVISAVRNSSEIERTIKGT